MKKAAYLRALQLSLELRNYAAHERPQSKETVRQAIVAHRLGLAGKASAHQLNGAKAPAAAGAWLKRQGRFVFVLDTLDALADEIHQGAPYWGVYRVVINVGSGPAS